MIYRRFGKTNISLPVLTFGAMRSIQTWDDKTPTTPIVEAQENLFNLLQAAMKHGINHFETGHGYGSSEYQLGKLLHKFKREDYILQTKVTPHDDAEVFVKKAKLSMEHLQVDYLDLLTIHGINDHKSLWQSCRKNGCLAGARKLQSEGIVGHIGFSGHGPCDIITTAIDHEEDGGFDFVNLHWHYILDVNRSAIKRAKERDLGVYIISPTDKGGRLWEPSDIMTELCAPLSPMLFNDCICLLQEGVTGIGVGASAPWQFDEHLKVLELLEQESTPSLIDEIDKRLGQRMLSATGYDRPDALWNKLPKWQETPMLVNMPMSIWLLQLTKGWGLDIFAKERYEKLGTGSEWVPGNNCNQIDPVLFSKIFIESDLNGDKIIQLLQDVHSQLSPKKVLQNIIAPYIVNQPK